VSVTTTTAPLDVLTDFPAIPQGWAYLDTAATSQKPRPVIDAITRAYDRDYATVHRGVYQRSADMTLAFEAARRRVARFIGGQENEIVFVRGATEGINLVAQCWAGTVLKPGDRILLSQLEHHSNIVPWQMVAERTGAAIDVVPLTEDHRIDLEAMAAMLTPQHKLVALAHVSNVLGSVLDADRVTFEKTTYAPPPGRFEAGTPHITGVIGLHAAIDYVDDIGLDRIHAHETALVATTRDALAGLNSVRVFGPADSAGIVSFEVQGVHPHDVATILDEGNVAIRAGHHCAQPLMDVLGVAATARASFGVYNGAADIDALVKGIERVTRIFG